MTLSEISAAIRFEAKHTRQSISLSKLCDLADALDQHVAQSSNRIQLLREELGRLTNIVCDADAENIQAVLDAAQSSAESSANEDSKILDALDGDNWKAERHDGATWFTFTFGPWEIDRYPTFRQACLAAMERKEKP